MNKINALMYTSVLAVGLTTGGVSCFAADMGSSYQAYSSNGPAVMPETESVIVNGQVAHVPMMETTQGPNGDLPGPSRPVGTAVQGTVLVPKSVIAAGESNIPVRDN